MSEVGTGLWLGIDTATGVCAGVGRPGEPLTSGSVPRHNAHAESLMPLVSDVVAQAGITLADLAGVVVGLGPGPFTGLRVGIVTAQTLALVLGVPLKGVCSLDVVALQHAATGPTGPYVVATDARRQELYWAAYDARGTRTEGPHVTRSTELPALPVVGPGADLYEVQGPTVPYALDAGLLAAAAGHLPDAGTEPLYLRRPDAEVPTTVKSTLPRRHP